MFALAARASAQGASTVRLLADEVKGLAAQ